MKQPLHPLLVHLPISLWLMSLLLDVVFLYNGRIEMARASYYAMLIGWIGAVLAAIAGLSQYFRIPRETQARRIATTHLGLNLVITALFLINLLIRHHMEGAAPSHVTVGQFTLSLISILLLSYSGYLGGVLVYGYGVGQESDESRGKAA